MATVGRIILLLGLLCSGLLFSAAVHAECGSQQQCIAVSIDPAVAPAHGAQSMEMVHNNKTAAKRER